MKKINYLFKKCDCSLINERLELRQTILTLIKIHFFYKEPLNVLQSYYIMSLQVNKTGRYYLCMLETKLLSLEIML